MKKSTVFHLISIFLIFVISSCGVNNYFSGDFKLIAGDLDFPEGPSWYRNQLVFSNCYSGWIGHLWNNTLDTLLDEEDGLLNTNGTVFDEEGNLYICEYATGSILKFYPDGKLITLSAKDHHGKRFNRPNDITISKNGFLYFTDPKSYDPDIYDGRLFRVHPETGETVWLVEGLQFPNGLCFSPDGEILYVGESVNKNILRIMGGIGLLDTLITLPSGNQDPDGMKCDSEGNIYIAYFGGGKIYVVSPEGTLLDSIKTPGRKPSNLEFGGKEMRTLFVTECETNSLYSIKTRIPGIKK
ncbi:MAG: SMP-30/gluconolactonase/LRE family protein [Candidatus Marinimicrobia bacterium]|nr:SMP-30/gluconolactonase/LRE family protein [Candidatus Neomarinimicrobiota bacterium]